MIVWRFVREAEQAPLKMLPIELGPSGNGHGVGVGDLNGDGKPTCW